MAVRKSEPADSIVDARISVDAPMPVPPASSTERAANERRRATEAFDSDTRIWSFNLRLMRAGAALLVAFEAIYFIIDSDFPPALTPAAVALHAGAVGITALVLALTMSNWFERNWRAVCLANLLAIYGLTLALDLLTGATEPLFITVVLTLIGAGALLRWSAGWQAWLSAIAWVITVIPLLVRTPAGLETVYRWAGVLIAAALGYFILLMRERHRAELAEWMDRVRTSHQELADALAQRATIMAERELAERRLREGEEMLRKVFDAAPDNIAITRMYDGAMLEVNQEFLKTGYTREEVLGVSTARIGRWPRGQLRALVDELRARGTVRNFETELRKKDGRVVPSLIAATLVDLGGEQCVVSMARDISELKQTQHEMAAAREALAVELRELEASQASLRSEIAERELAQRRLQENEQTLRKMFETSLDSIAINRLSDGRFIAVNDEYLRVTGYSREEVLASTGAELKAFVKRERMREMLARLRADGFVRNFEIDLRTRNGRFIPHLFSATVANVAGELCVIAIIHDISTLKQTERELIAAREAALAASEAKSHFLSVMSHEIRTPMNAILGMADLLSETPLSAEQRRYLDTMRNNSASLLNLINGILDLSKVESGRLSLERADFDLVELAEDVMETLGVRAHEKGFELALRVAPTFPTALTGDPLRLRQILLNLLGNAIKFTERGEVTLTIDAVDSAEIGESPRPQAKAEAAAASGKAGPSGGRQRLRFVVRDTGIGIPPDRQEAVFSNFSQADSTISRKYGGSGLGLAIVKRLVELMDGKIAVESRPGEGSAFSFTVALELRSGAAAAGPTLAGMARLTGKRVLVVDDSQASRAILTEMIELTGAEVFVTSDGAAALNEIVRARAAGRPYDAVVADNRMPPPDGAAIAQQIMSTSHTAREATVLMLTADDLNPQLGRLRERGLEESPRCRHLLKPVRRADLWAALAAACSDVVEEHLYRNGTDAAAAAAHPARPDSLLQRGASRTAAVVVNKALRILLAEDSPDNRLLVQAYLKNTPYRLDYAENGEVAVHKFATGHYDVILMDIEMPVMDGYEAIAEIRRLEQSDHRRTTPIIALTASAQDEAVRRSLQMGCDAHVIKPVKRSTLLEAISDAVKPAPQQAYSATDASGDGADGVAATVSAQPIVVQIDQDLSDLVPGFLARKREDARAVLAAVEHGDAEAIARLGHKMKGEGGSYGLDAVTDLGRELEQAGKDSDFDAARRLGRDLTNFLERLEIVYRPIED
ncbi:MAG: response regulator [Candidatus Binataceae bacterium]